MTNSKPQTTESHLSDDVNPRFLFTRTFTTLLLQVANGTINAETLAKKELVNRGLDTEGKWVGFHRAAEIHLGWDFRNPNEIKRLIHTNHELLSQQERARAAKIASLLNNDNYKEAGKLVHSASLKVQNITIK